MITLCEEEYLSLKGGKEIGGRGKLTIRSFVRVLMYSGVSYLELLGSWSSFIV
jgi:hypothetical protein